MADRAAMERVIAATYAARAAGDLDATLAHFAEEGGFSLAGCSESSPVPCRVHGLAAIRDLMAGLIWAFELKEVTRLSTLIDGHDAAVRLRLRVRSTVTGREAVTDVVDLIRFEGDRIVSYTQFADTALASRLIAP